jgi:tRNA threonylcarbamoyladenosine biosynthesis protein TsaB
MIILALDTAGVDCAAAVYDSDGDRVLAEITDTIGKGHAEHLIALIDRVLDKAGFGLEAVERIAVTIGPGSFTGIRVGVAAARGFALSLGIPAVGVATLAVIAADHQRKSPGRAVLVAMDAKRGEVYLQAFDADGAALEDARALLIGEAQSLASSFDGDVAGSAAPFLRGEAVVEPITNNFPIAAVARLGAAMVPGEKPKPLYLRGPDAKPQVGFALARQ